MRKTTFLLLIAILVSSAASAVEYVNDQNGCQHWLAQLEPKTQIAWSGSCGEGLASGKGVQQTYVQGTLLNTYEGPLLKGKRHGKGRYRNKYGDVYEGDFTDGQFTGLGRYSYGDGENKGDRYEGSFVNGRFWGKGRYLQTNGNRYEGDYVDGKEQGQGTFTFGTGKFKGDHYQGGFSNGEFSGSGIYQHADGIRYQGEYQNGRRNGQGILTLADGSRYSGGFRDGKYHGRGTLEFHGYRYDGDFVDGAYSGDGHFRLPDGAQLKGQFGKNRLINGKTISTDGKWTALVENGEIVSVVDAQGRRTASQSEREFGVNVTKNIFLVMAFAARIAELKITSKGSDTNYSHRKHKADEYTHWKETFFGAYQTTAISDEVKKGSNPERCLLRQDHLEHESNGVYKNICNFPVWIIAPYQDLDAKEAWSDIYEERYRVNPGEKEYIWNPSNHKALAFSVCLNSPVWNDPKPNARDYDFGYWERGHWECKTD